MRLLRTLLVIGILIITESAHAKILYSNLQPDGSYDGLAGMIIGNDFGTVLTQGDLFRATASGDATLLRVPFFAYVGSPDVTFSLYGQSGTGVPPTLLGTFGLSGAGLPIFTGLDYTTLQLVTVGSIPLTAGSFYTLFAQSDDPSLADSWSFSYQLGIRCYSTSSNRGCFGPSYVGAFELTSSSISGVSSASSVPEPCTLVLLASGVVGLAGVVRRSPSR
jgi:hypothetical protein